MEFVCTASLFLLALHWGPSGIALAWTVSYFLLMFPGFWYAGKPIGLGIGPVFAVIWKFFVASAVAGFGTALIIRAVPHFATASGASGAFVRMVSVSLVFFALYFGGVIALHQGLKPISETVALCATCCRKVWFRHCLHPPIHSDVRANSYIVRASQTARGFHELERIQTTEIVGDPRDQSSTLSGKHSHLKR